MRSPTVEKVLRESGPRPFALSSGVTMSYGTELSIKASKHSVHLCVKNCSPFLGCVLRGRVDMQRPDRHIRLEACSSVNSLQSRCSSQYPPQPYGLRTIERHNIADHRRTTQPAHLLLSCEAWRKKKAKSIWRYILLQLQMRFFSKRYKITSLQGCRRKPGNPQVRM